MLDREIFTNTINQYLPEPHASLLNGMLLGVKLKQTQDFYEAVKKVGLLHIVVLSGSNISLITEIIKFATSEISIRLSFLIIFILLSIFLSLVPLEAPIVRASLTYLFTFVCTLLGKRSHSIYLLFIAGVLTHFIIPEAITSISFQLSYAATIGMIYASNKKTIAQGFSGYFTENLRVSLITQAFTAPIIFYYFREISIIAPVANLFIGWTLMPIMFFGLLTITLGTVSYFLGLVPAMICYILLSFCVFIINLLASIPYGFLKL